MRDGETARVELVDNRIVVLANHHDGDVGSPDEDMLLDDDEDAVDEVAGEHTMDDDDLFD